ncbi:coiled coils domain protein [Faustovirus]|nr:coiled coils domain protein [Faustovirus]
MSAIKAANVLKRKREETTELANKRLKVVKRSIIDVVYSINAKLNDDVRLDTPKLLFFGSQNSGKSTVINRYVEADIMPARLDTQVFDAMTRVPITMKITRAEKLCLIAGGRHELNNLRDIQDQVRNLLQQEQQNHQILEFTVESPDLAPVCLKDFPGSNKSENILCGGEVYNEFVNEKSSVLVYCLKCEDGIMDSMAFDYAKNMLKHDADRVFMVFTFPDLKANNFYDFALMMVERHNIKHAYILHNREKNELEWLQTKTLGKSDPRIKLGLSALREDINDVIETRFREHKNDYKQLCTRKIAEYKDVLVNRLGPAIDDSEEMKYKAYEDNIRNYKEFIRSLFSDDGKLVVELDEKIRLTMNECVNRAKSVNAQQVSNIMAHYSPIMPVFTDTRDSVIHSALYGPEGVVKELQGTYLSALTDIKQILFSYITKIKMESILDNAFWAKIKDITLSLSELDTREQFIKTSIESIQYTDTVLPLVASDQQLTPVDKALAHWDNSIRILNQIFRASIISGVLSIHSGIDKKLSATKELLDLVQEKESSKSERIRHIESINTYKEIIEELDSVN